MAMPPWLAPSRRSAIPSPPQPQRRCSAVEDAGLLSLELIVREDTLLLQRREILELGQLVVHARFRRCRWRWRWRCVHRLLLLRLLLLVRLLVLLGPASGLAPRDPVGHGGGRAGDRSGSRNSANKSWHRSLPFSGGSARRGGRGGFGRGKQGLDRNATIRDQLPAAATERARQGRCPHVFIDKDAGRAPWLEHASGFLEIVLAEQSRGRALEDRQV